MFIFSSLYRNGLDCVFQAISHFAPTPLVDIVPQEGEAEWGGTEVSQTEGEKNHFAWSDLPTACFSGLKLGQREKKEQIQASHTSRFSERHPKESQIT